MLSVKDELLGPDHDVVGREREHKPRCICFEGVEREVPGTGCLQRLDAVLNFGVRTVHGLKGSDVGAVLVGDEALEAVPVEVCEGELRAGVWALAAADEPGPRGS